MRVQFQFIMSALPKAFRLGLLSILKEMIRQGSESFYEQLFEQNKHKLKPFAYAPYIHKMDIEEEKIVGEQLDLTVSSSSYEFMLHLMNGSHRHDMYSIQGYELELKRKRMLPKPPQFSTTVTFKTLSPLLIEDKTKTPLIASKDKAFVQEFNYYAQLIVRELYDRNLHEPVRILNSSMKKIVIQENIHQTQNTPIYLTTNHGLLQLKGHPDDLQALYENGVGRRRSLGLGLLGIEEVTYA